MVLSVCVIVKLQADCILGFWFLQRKTGTVLHFGKLQIWAVKQVLKF